MIKKLPVLLYLFLALPLAVLAQNGKLSGTVLDRDTKEPVPFAAVRVLSGGQLKGGGVADENGQYVVSPLTPGTYQVEASALGFRKIVVNEVRINFETTTRLNLSLPNEAKELNEVVVETYRVPLIDKDNTSTGTKLTGKDIEKLPSRNINTVLTTTAGVFSNDDGGALNVRGNRGGDNIVFVNGVRQFGTQYPPVETIAEISVITGGVPAQYGDALGGIISVTTKGAASNYRAGIQYETSRIFDRWNYNLVGGNFSGPLLRKTTTDPTTNKTSTRTILGVYAAYTYEYNRDPSPSAYNYLVAKPEVLRELEQRPFRLVPLADGSSVYRSAADFLQPGDFERVQARPNAAAGQNQFNLTLDYQPKENIIISVGGNYNYGHRQQSSNFNLFNYGLNPIFSRHDYNGFIRFRQTFPNLGNTESGFGLKNFYYQVQADYSRNFGISEDSRFRENVELYNYFGKFRERRVAFGADSLLGPGAAPFFYVYQPGTSTIVDSIPLLSDPSTRYRIVGNTISQGLLGGYDFEPFSGAGPAVNRNLQILDEFRGAPFGPNNIYQLLPAFGGLINGDARNNVDWAYNFFPGLNIDDPTQTVSPFSYPGQLLQNYGWNSDEQYRFTGQVAGDIGKHSIKLGFEYEQRVQRLYGAGDESNSLRTPWGAARRLLNNHIVNSPLRGTSNSSFTTSYLPNGNRVITIDPDLAVLTNGEGNIVNQSAYDRRIRQILGLPNNRLINPEELDPSLLSLRNFTPGELFGDGQNPVASYRGVNAYGDRYTARPSFNDFFTDTINRPIDAFRPIYLAGYIEDKFEINDLIIRAGVRVDQFDINQQVLRDNYSLTRLTTVGEANLGRFRNAAGEAFRTPGNIGSDYAVYLDKSADELVPGTNENEFRVVGFRNGRTFYDANGGEISNPVQIAQNGNFFPLYDITRLNTFERNLQRDRGITLDAFTDFRPQTNVMPRLAFSFPISEDALFFAHYDVLTQRPVSVTGNGRSGPNTGSNFGSPLQYYNLRDNNNNPFLTNPNLRPQRKIDYQLGFQQRLSQNTALKLSAFYSEVKDLIQVVNIIGGYPNPSFRTNDNIDFGVMKGMTASFDYRKRGGLGFGMNASYTLQFTEGSASDFATALLNTNTPNLRNITPQNWDQRHAIKLNLDYRTGDKEGPSIGGFYPFANAGINTTTFLGSGNPYTVDGSFWGGRSQIQGSINGARLPWNNRTGLRIDKTFYFKGLTSSEESSLNVYFYVQNLFNQVNTLEVYRRTGRPDDNGFLVSQFGQNQLSQGNIAPFSQETYIFYYQQLMLNPDFVTLPRRFRIGVSYSF